MKKLAFIITSLLVFGIFNYSIYEKEKIKTEGETVFLELAPVDPRSLMQGDYMRLNYAINNQSGTEIKEKRGYLVISIDPLTKVAKFSRFHNGEILAANEKLLRFHNQYGRVRIVPDSFMFQEGHAKIYEGAKYGVFKFNNTGDHILVDLADTDRRLIQTDTEMKNRN